MTKFYVSTGSHKIVLLADDAKSAAEKGVERFKSRQCYRPGRLTIVSEVGFSIVEDDSSPDHKNDLTYETCCVTGAKRKKKT